MGEREETDPTAEVMLSENQRTALDHAFEDARTCLASDGGMCAFSILATADGFVVSDHPGESVDDVYRSARALMARELPESYVFCYDGFVETDAGRVDAIICETARRGAPHATILAQTYSGTTPAIAFAGGYMSAGEAKSLYPAGTKPIVSGLVALAAERERQAEASEQPPAIDSEKE